MKIKALTGPYAGKVRAVAACDDAYELLWSMVERGWDWVIKFERRDDQDVLEVWAHADLDMRIVRALRDGRGVHFMGTTYVAIMPEDIEAVVEHLGEQFRQYDCPLVIDRDDAAGLQIGLVRGWMH